MSDKAVREKILIQQRCAGNRSQADSRRTNEVTPCNGKVPFFARIHHLLHFVVPSISAPFHQNQFSERLQLLA